MNTICAFFPNFGKLISKRVLQEVKDTKEKLKSFADAYPKNNKKDVLQLLKITLPIKRTEN